FLRNRNLCITGLRCSPKFHEPRGRRRKQNKHAATFVFQKQKAEFMQELRQGFRHVQPTIFLASWENASSTPSPVLALERRTVQFFAASRASISGSSSHSSTKSHLLITKTKGICPISL